MRDGEDGRLRISDGDRDQISAVLGQHAAEGRLTMEELDQRVGMLYAAQTRAQAAAVVADLPALAAHTSRHTLHHHAEHGGPTLPDWLAAGELAAGPPADVSPTAATPSPAHESPAAARKRAKLRQDENAIGHTFQATRRSLSAALEAARRAGDADEVRRLEERLTVAQSTAESARRAVAAGDRSQAQNLLARLRTLG